MEFIKGIKEKNKTFVIAEIGQNHQGDIEIAKKLIKVAKDCGADCAKFQKTCLKEKFTKSALDAPYLGENSWGSTYGHHKSYLEFSNEDFLELQSYAKKIGIFFTASAMDCASLDFLKEINVPFIKIGSGDSNNFLILKEAAQSGIPLVISTGMLDFETAKEIYTLVSKHHKNFALLHCVSSYPTPYHDVNLEVIKLYQQEFPDIIIGYSGHELGTHISVAAVAMGAKIIERHITLNKHQKGSDHRCSLEPQELKELIENIRTLELALGRPLKKFQECEKACYEKLGKSLVYAGDFERGHVIGEKDVKIKVSIPKGIDGAKLKHVFDSVLCCDVKEDDALCFNHFST